MEKSILGFSFVSARKLVNIVNNKHVYHLIEIQKIVHIIFHNGGINILILKLVCFDIKNKFIGIFFHGFNSDSMSQMCFAQT